MSCPAVLRLREIRVLYENRTVLDGLDLDVHRGEIVCLAGRNGCGKSTTLRVAAGILDPSSGTAEIEGILRSQNPDHYARQLGFVPQESALYEDLTAVQNLEFFGKLYGIRGYVLDSRISKTLARANLSNRAHDRVRDFSGGMKRRLNISLAMLHEPVVLLLDEPTAGLDAESRFQLYDSLQILRNEGHAILLTTHHLEELDDCCDRIAHLENGQVSFMGDSLSFQRSQRTGRPVLFGQLQSPIPKFLERRIRKRLDDEVELEVIGRRVRISAWNTEEIGRSLALLLSEGVIFESFRSTINQMQPVLEAA